MRNWNVRPANRRKEEKLSLFHALSLSTVPLNFNASSKIQPEEEKSKPEKIFASSPPSSVLLVNQLASRVPDITHDPLESAASSASRRSSASTHASLTTTDSRSDNPFPSDYATTQAFAYYAQTGRPEVAMASPEPQHINGPVALRRYSDIEASANDAQPLHAIGYRVHSQPALDLDADLTGHAGTGIPRPTFPQAYSEGFSGLTACPPLEPPPQTAGMSNEGTSMTPHHLPSLKYPEPEWTNAVVSKYGSPAQQYSPLPQNGLEITYIRQFGCDDGNTSTPDRVVGREPTASFQGGASLPRRPLGCGLYDQALF